MFLWKRATKNTRKNLKYADVDKFNIIFISLNTLKFGVNDLEWT